MQTDRDTALSRREARRIESSRRRSRRPLSFVVGFLVALVAFAGGGWAMSSLISGSGLVSLGKPSGGSDSVRIVSDDTDKAAAPADRSDSQPAPRTTTTDASRATTRTKPSRTTTTSAAAEPSVKTTTIPATRKTKKKPSAPAETSTTTTPVAAGTGGSGGTQTADEAEVLRLVNVERGKAGCKPVSANATLVKVARAHSKDMAVKNYFDHNSPDGRTPFQRMSAAGYKYSWAAENIAAGKSSPADIMDMWMNSAGHKANILNCKLTQLGVGKWSEPGSTYTHYWTQDFGTPQ